MSAWEYILLFGMLGLLAFFIAAPIIWPGDGGEDE